MNCAVIRDLLPLYCDQVCSPESRQAVEEHLAGCPQCRACYEKMAAPAEGGAELELDVEPVEAAKGFHRKLRRSKRRSVLAAVLAAAAVCLGGTAAADVERPVPYQDGLITAEMAYDQVIDVYYYGGSYSSSRGFSRAWEGRNAVFLEYTETIKSGLIPDGEPAHIAIGNGFLLDTEKGDAFQVDREIQAVYYLTGDYDALLQMEEGEFAQAAEDAVLLWESE